MSVPFVYIAVMLMVVAFVVGIIIGASDIFRMTRRWMVLEMLLFAAIGSVFIYFAATGDDLSYCIIFAIVNLGFALSRIPDLRRLGKRES